MKPIVFTQFLLPHGRRVTITIERPDDIADKASELVAASCQLEIEMLTTGEISMAVEYGDETLAIEIVPNGPAVPIGVDKMITEAHRHLALRPSMRADNPPPA